MKKKNFATWGRLLKEMGYEDEHLLEEVIAGFPLAGKATRSHIFEQVQDEEPIDIDKLARGLSWRNRALSSKIKSSGSAKVDLDLFRHTMDEIEKGLLIGPFKNLDDLETYLGRVPVISHRFAVVQGAKIRPIDDFSESSVNACFVAGEKIGLHDVDVVAGVIRLLDEACAGQIDRVVLSDGSVRPLRVHPDWRKGARITGKSMDLSSAYKQLAVNPKSLWTAGGACFDPRDGGKIFFVQRSLPFGASASVHAFNRCSRSLWSIGTRLALLPWTVFFDDFIILSPAPLERAAKAVASMIALATGWSVSEGPKDKEFAEQFEALGVSFRVLGVASAPYPTSKIGCLLSERCRRR